MEGSKSFAKLFMQRHRIPTGHYAVVTNKAELHSALDHLSTPIVVKADGLAAGKGVVIAQDERRSHHGRARNAQRQNARRSGPARGAGRVSYRRRTFFPRNERWGTWRAAGRRAGPQARRRQRYRPQHRRHGRLQLPIRSSIHKCANGCSPTSPAPSSRD